MRDYRARKRNGGKSRGQENVRLNGRDWRKSAPPVERAVGGKALRRAVHALSWPVGQSEVTDMAKATVKTSSGREVSGEVVRERGGSMSLAEGLASIATLGLVDIGNQPKTTVKVESGQYHTGTKK